MARISTITTGTRVPATTVFRLSPERAGVTGAVQLPTGEPVAIGDLLPRILSQYGLQDSRDEEAARLESERLCAMRFDVLA